MQCEPPKGKVHRILSWRWSTPKVEDPPPKKNEEGDKIEFFFLAKFTLIVSINYRQIYFHLYPCTLLLYQILTFMWITDQLWSCWCKCKLQEPSIFFWLVVISRFGFRWSFEQLLLMAFRCRVVQTSKISWKCCSICAKFVISYHTLYIFLCHRSQGIGSPSNRDQHTCLGREETCDPRPQA